MAVVAEMKKTNDHAETTKVDRLKYTKMFNYIEVYYKLKGVDSKTCALVL